jgi:uncharacterized OB-fold protein
MTAPPAPTKHLKRVIDATASEFYRRLAQDGVPSGTRCPACATPATFPPRSHCAACGGATEWVALPGRGRLEAFTTQETALRFPAPAVLALARLGEAVVPGIADAPYEDLRVGDEVEVVARREPALALTLVHYRCAGRGAG